MSNPVPASTAQHGTAPGDVPAKAPDNVGKSPVAPGTNAPDDGEGLPMPHERDESLATQDDAQREVMDQARKDIESGQVDTELRATPGQDAAQRDKLMSDGAGKTIGKAAAAPAGPSR